MNKTNRILLPMCILASLGVHADTNDNTQIDVKKWYAGASIGSTSYDLEEFDVIGIEIERSFDKNDTGFKVYGGYQINQYFAVEVAYANLGEFSISQNTSGDLGQPSDGLFDITSNSTFEVSGIMLNGIAQYPITDSVAVFAKLGAFKWDSDSYSTSLYNIYEAVDGVIPVEPTETMNGTDSFSDSDTDAFYGLGLSYKIADFDIRAEYEIYKSDGESINVASIGALYRF